MQDKFVLVIGAGAWGKKIVDTLSKDLGVRRLAILHRNTRDHAELAARYPKAMIKTSLDEITEPIDLAVVATQTSTQHEILTRLAARRCATLVEKPFCQTLAEAKSIADIYRANETALFVDNIYLYSDAFRRFAATFAREFEIGPYTYTSRRWDFGSFPKDTNTLSHLIYHDLAMLDGLVGLETLQPVAYRNDIAHYAQLTLRDARGSIYDLTASQISATKVRTIGVANSTRGLDWNDLDGETPLRLTNFDVEAKSKSPLEPALLEASRYSPLGNVLAHALENSAKADSTSLDVALKVKAFIEEVEA